METKRTIQQNKAPWNKGKKLPKLSREHKDKISKSLKGKIPKNISILNEWWKNHTMSDEHKRNIGIKSKGRKKTIEGRRRIALANSGSKSHLWKGGVTPEIRRIRNTVEYKIWRRAVFERDDYTCIWCFKRGGILNADHIKSFRNYPELRFAIDNGRTLCVDCHKRTDNYGSKGKFTNN